MKKTLLRFTIVFGQANFQWSSNVVIKGGTHITIIGLISLRFYPFPTMEDYLLYYKIILYDYVVCSVLRVNVSQ